jgi:hypothetical protein
MWWRGDGGDGGLHLVPLERGDCGGALSEMHVLPLQRRCSTSTHASTRDARMHVSVLYCAWHARTLPHALALPHVMHETWPISHSNCVKSSSR